MANYFSGKNGRLTIPDKAMAGQVVDSGLTNDELKLTSWEFTKVTTPVDISNTRSYGKEQYIGNLSGGTITAEGYMTDTFLESLIQVNIEPGNYVKFDLYFDFNSAPKKGFFGINGVWAIIENFVFSDDYADTGAFSISAIVSDEPE